MKDMERLSSGKEDVSRCQNGMKSVFDSRTDVIDAKDLFLHLHQKAVALGLNQTQLQQLTNLKHIKYTKKMEILIRFLKSTMIIAVLSISVVASWAINWPVPNVNIAKFWLKLMGENPSSLNYAREKCLIKASNKIQDLARPPITCNFCTNTTSVLRVSGISEDEFQEKFAYSAQPVVVQDGAANWSALNVFNFNFFKDLYASDSLALKNTEEYCQFFPYKTEFRHLGEVFLMDEHRALLKDASSPWYIGWSNCDTDAGSLLRSHYTKPYFLPQDSESSQTDWIFMGSPGYGAHMHVDNVALPSWQAQITGHKKWSLQPPPECYGWCWYDLSVTVHPGEIIVLDTNKWFHSTLNVGNDISITIGSEFD